MGRMEERGVRGCRAAGSAWRLRKKGERGRIGARGQSCLANCRNRPHPIPTTCLSHPPGVQHVSCTHLKNLGRVVMCGGKKRMCVGPCLPGEGRGSETAGGAEGTAAALAAACRDLRLRWSGPSRSPSSASAPSGKPPRSLLDATRAAAEMADAALASALVLAARSFFISAWRACSCDWRPL